jgi:hypothetical protein
LIISTGISANKANLNYIFSGVALLYYETALVGGVINKKSNPNVCLALLANVSNVTSVTIKLNSQATSILALIFVSANVPLVR